MKSDDVNRIIQNYPDISILDAEQEREIANTMDRTMEELAQTLLAQSNLLEQVTNILLEQYQTGPILDEFLTQYDLLLLAQHFPDQNIADHVSYKTLSICLVKLECDRSTVFNLLLKEADKVDQYLERQALALKKKYEQKRNALVQANIRLVIHIAKRYADKGIDIEELIQEGSLGLLLIGQSF